MNKYILVVINEENFEAELEVLLNQLAEEKFSGEGAPQLMLDFESDVKKAKARVEDADGKYNLLIVDNHIFPDSGTSSYETQNEGLKLLRDLRDSATPFFAVLICTDIDQEIYDFPSSCSDNMSCEVLLKKGDWVGHFMRKVEKGLGQQQAEEKKRGKVDIYLDQNKYSMEAEGFVFETLLKSLEKIDERDKQKLINRSRKVNERPDWDDELHSIGGHLLRKLFYVNPGFQDHFTKLVDTAGGEENIRIRYVVEEKIHPLALEAIVDEKNEYRMLHCPIFRSVNTVCDKAPLFKDKETQTKPINCLIINANSVGEPQWEGYGGSLNLESLEKAKEETRQIENMMLGKSKGCEEFKSSINNVTLLSPEKTEKDFYSWVTEVLENGTPWHLVHFAGHSHYIKETQKGYVFFPDKHGQPVPVAIESFAKSLRKADARLVYLSSCLSADIDFVFKLSENNIPATLGFRCPIINLEKKTDPKKKIDHKKALKHALIFYKKLFLGSKRLEYAFLDTRKKLKKKYGNDSYIWAVSILTMQYGN